MRPFYIHGKQFNLLTFGQHKCRELILDYKSLFQACLVAISLQVALFPILWFIGWALPWPKPPIFTTIIEYELDKSQEFKPKHVLKIRDPKLNPAN
jgi:hypothetical protein